MKTKPLFTLAIIALLPITAHADYVYNEVDRPTPVSYNGGTVTVAEEAPPYETITVTNDDASHIASTAYVKGAYNDAITAVNTAYESLNSDLNDVIPTFQPKLVYTAEGGVEHYIEPGVYNWLWNDDYSHIDPDATLVNMTGIRNAITDVNTTISNKRVEIYTTWENDNAKTQVAFVNASGNN